MSFPEDVNFSIHSSKYNWKRSGELCCLYKIPQITFGNNITNLSDRNQNAIPLFSDAGILPLQFSYYELTANLMFDFRHRNAPRNIGDLFQDVSNIHPYNTRSSASHNFYTQNSRLSIQLNSFSRIGTKIWNIKESFKTWL